MVEFIWMLQMNGIVLVKYDVYLFPSFFLWIEAKLIDAFMKTFPRNEQQL